MAGVCTINDANLPSLVRKLSKSMVRQTSVKLNLGFMAKLDEVLRKVEVEPTTKQSRKGKSKGTGVAAKN